MQCNAIQYNTIQYNTIQYNTIQYNTMQYLIVPASSASTIQSELAQASSCAAEANLALNLGKTQKKITTRSSRICHKQTIPVTATGSVHKTNYKKSETC